MVNTSVRLNLVSLIPVVQVMTLEITLNAELLEKLDTRQLITYL